MVNVIINIIKGTTATFTSLKYWILRDGTWSDGGRWKDNDIWKDS